MLALRGVLWRTRVPAGVLALAWALLPSAAAAQAPQVTGFDVRDVGPADLGSMTYSFRVFYSDDVAIDVSSIDTLDVSISGPGGPLAVTSASPSSGIDLPRVTATYVVTPPGGSWDPGDDGTYTIALNALQVFDSSGLAVPAVRLLATFVVDVSGIPPQVSSFSFPDVSLADFGETTYSFTIEYSDDMAIDVSSIDTSDVSVGGPGGGLTVTSATPSSGADQPTVTVTYTTTPPGGSWDPADNGTYTIGVIAVQVLDTSAAAVPADPNVGIFAVNATPIAPVPSLGPWSLCALVMALLAMHRLGRRPSRLVCGSTSYGGSSIRPSSRCAGADGSTTWRSGTSAAPSTGVCRITTRPGD